MSTAGRPRALALGLAVTALCASTASGTPAPRVPTPRLDPARVPEAPTAVARVGPAVVGIRARIPRARPSAAVLGTERRGSGVIVDPDGLVLTAGYVVLEAARLEVRLQDARTLSARVLGHDFESGLAVLRLGEPGPYPVATLGRSETVRAGQLAATVGAAEDSRLVAVTVAVTAVRRFVAHWEYLLERALIVAPANRAFGGAALVDPDGALIGIASLRVGEENLAIPIDVFPSVREAMIARGRPDRPPRPWLGLRTMAVPGGVGIAGVSPAGPAEAGGLRHGDVVVRLDGERVADVEDFYRKLWRTAVGRDLRLTVYRDGRLETVTVRPQDRYAVFQFRSE